MKIIRYLRVLLLRCPRCGSRRNDTRTRTEKQYVAGDHQAYESTAGWVYGHKEILISFRHCLDCGEDFAGRRKVVKKRKARGARSAKRSGGYGTE